MQRNIAGKKEILKTQTSYIYDRVFNVPINYGTFSILWQKQ